MEYFDHLPNWMIFIAGAVFMSLWKKIRAIAKEVYIWFETLVLNLVKKTTWERARRFATLRPYARVELANEHFSLLRVPGSDQSYQIDTVFVPLRVKNQAHNSDSILKIGKRLIIIGEPGAGKTSLINKLYRDACKENKKWFSKGPFPVVIRLKNLRNGDTASIQETIRKNLKEKSVTELEACYDASLSGKGVLILLDGLDEVASANYPIIRDEILALAKQLDTNPNSQLVLTMRTQFHLHVGDDFRDEFANIAELNRFENSDVFEFLSRWPFKNLVDEHISRIHKQLVMRPSLREMCTNPLILAMYVARDLKHRDEPSPVTRSEFYDTVVQELLYKRRAKQLNRDMGMHTIKEQREHILGQLAFIHLMDEKSNRNDISHELALEVTQKVLDSNRVDAELFFDDLAKETGLISEGKMRSSWMFIHLTFCEFFSALYAVKHSQLGWSKLIDRAAALQADPQHADRLAEVIPFACGLLPPKDRDGAIDDLKIIGQNRIMLRCFFESKVYTHIAWTEHLTKMSQELLETKDWTHERLDDLLWFTITVGDANYEALSASGITTLDLQTFLKKLSNLEDIILTYSSSDPDATLQLINACGMDPLKFPELIAANCHGDHFLSLLQPIITNDSRSSEWARVLLASCDSTIKFNSFAKRQHWLEWSHQSMSVYPSMLVCRRGSLLEQLLQSTNYSQYNEYPSEIKEQLEYNYMPSIIGTITAFSTLIMIYIFSSVGISQIFHTKATRIDTYTITLYMFFLVFFYAIFIRKRKSHPINLPVTIIIKNLLFRPQKWFRSSVDIDDLDNLK